MALNVKVLFSSKDAPDISLVTRYELRSAMSELFDLTIEAHIADAALDMSTVVGERVSVWFGDEPFWINLYGIVREARQVTSEPGFVSVYELEIVPDHWLMTRSTDQYIFQDLTVPEIVAKVVEAYEGRIPGAPATQFVREYPQREYCVQYEETDLDFVFRILAEEGIASYFDHHQKPQDGEPVTATDDWTLTDLTTRGKPDYRVPYTPSSGTTPIHAGDAAKPHVLRVSAASNVETSRATAMDFDYEKPKPRPYSSTEAPKPLFASEAELEAYDYEVGRFRTEQEGQDLTTRRLESLRALRTRYRCETSFALAPGTRFVVTGSPWGDIDLLVVRASTHSKFRNTTSAIETTHVLECIPGDTVPFRPRRRPKQRIYGTQTAFVVGKEYGKDEIDIDTTGRVKVRFHWDRRETSREGKPTRYLRVSQGWAGAGYGMVMHPRVGDELIIAYLDGDPDEPIVVGRVHNAAYISPLTPSTIPEPATWSVWQSRSSPWNKDWTEGHFNLIGMQDKTGQELLQMRAQKDFMHDTLHNSTITVGGSQSTSAGAISMSSGSDITMDAKDLLSERADHFSITADTTGLISATSQLALISGSEVEVEAPLVSVTGEGATIIYGGANVVINSDGTVVVTAKSTVAVEAPIVVVNGKGVVTVTGGTVDIHTAGIVNVKGGTINLNC